MEMERTNKMDYKKKAEEFPFAVSKETFDGEKTLFVASFYDYQNIIGEGDDAKSALDEAYTNLSVYLEYLFDTKGEIKKPTVKDMTKDKGWRITLRMTDKLHETLLARSEAENMSANAVILDALSEYLYSFKTVKTEEREKSPVYFSGSLANAFKKCWVSQNKCSKKTQKYNKSKKVELAAVTGK